MFGNRHTHDRPIRELAVGAQAAVVFADYDLSPEARYPTALEQNFAVAQWVADHGLEHALDPERMAVAGDSVGGNMTAALTLLAKERGAPVFRQQVLFYPVTGAGMDTGSYHESATGYFLRADAMAWFWDQYTTDPTERAEITASPLQATTDQLAGLPPPSSSPPRPACSTTKARPTPTSCAKQVCPSQPSASRASSTTSSCSTPRPTPMPPGLPWL